MQHTEAPERTPYKHRRGVRHILVGLSLLIFNHVTGPSSLFSTSDSRRLLLLRLEKRLIVSQHQRFHILLHVFLY